MKFTATHWTAIIVAAIAAIVVLSLHGLIPERVTEAVAGTIAAFVTGLAVHPPDWLRKAVGLEPLVKESEVLVPVEESDDMPPRSK